MGNTCFQMILCLVTFPSTVSMIPAKYLQPEFTLGTPFTATIWIAFFGLGFVLIFHYIYQAGFQDGRHSRQGRPSPSLAVNWFMLSIGAFLPNLILGQILARIFYYWVGWENGHLLVYLPIGFMLLYIPLAVLEGLFSIFSLPFLIWRRKRRKPGDEQAAGTRYVLRPDLLPDWYRPDMPQALFEALIEQSRLPMPPTRDEWDKQYERLKAWERVLDRIKGDQ